MLATINEILFPTFLFIVIFCFLSCLTYNQENKPSQEVERIDNFANEVKEAFLTQFDPKPEVKESIIITQDNQRTKASKKKIISLNPVTNPQISTVPSQPIQPNFTTMKLKELKQYIRDFNLQSEIKSICGKSFSKCTKVELIQALS
ncbi:hypothetical protein [Crocosphaera chwakensis]|uniref:Uncharacterized protein n=1 Tax=Crocosphaera chwakensis CCY0110 TaxID=391612 RepID=A3IYX4_9CHRO|nr:hypothetical protein [Crocosphaera chwakensis]EAZ88314.1 hypothetical protein CY0110_14810 [Crocosphaera chwakensis CCY0110]